MPPSALVSASSAESGLDPELIEFGGHARFGPLLKPGLVFRPGIDFGLGEVTTTFGVNLDFLYLVNRGSASWAPYFGAGPNFALSHRGFEVDGDDIDHVNTIDSVDDNDRNRFDFGDTDFVSGFNFIAGARRPNGLFFRAASDRLRRVKCETAGGLQLLTGRFGVTAPKYGRTVTAMAFLVQMILPLYNNNGRPFAPEMLKQVRTELSEKFGGLTAYTRTPAEGTWEDDGGRTRT
jgi:hypothetical protein